MNPTVFDGDTHHSTSLTHGFVHTCFDASQGDVVSYILAWGGGGETRMGGWASGWVRGRKHLWVVEWVGGGFRCRVGYMFQRGRGEEGSGGAGKEGREEEVHERLFCY